MIIVTGTKRSGTSMWMQILSAAGYRVLGERFPRDWGSTIRAANERGFFESPLRHGIRDLLARDPTTGEVLRPEATREVAVKVFAAGLTRTHLAHMHRVVASVRHLDTSYDELLMAGVPREVAREQVRPAIDQTLATWRDG